MTTWPRNKSDFLQLSCYNLWLYKGTVVNVIGTVGSNPKKPYLMNEETHRKFVPGD